MGTQKVLIIDFDPEFRKFLCRFLGDQGFSVLSAQDGSAGLELVNQEKPDLVVTEAMLPKLPGFELCSQIANRSKIPVVIVTGVYKDAAYKTEAMRTFGAAAFFEKPLNTEAFLATVREILGIAVPVKTVPQKKEDTTRAEKTERLWDQVKSLENIDLLLEKTLAEFGIHQDTKKPSVSQPVRASPQESPDAVVKDSWSVPKLSPLPTKEDYFNLIKTTPPARKPASPVPPSQAEKAVDTAAAAVNAGGSLAPEKTEPPLQKRGTPAPIRPEVPVKPAAAGPPTARTAGESEEAKSKDLSETDKKIPEKKIAEDEPRPEASFPGFSFGTQTEKRPRNFSPKIFGFIGGAVVLAVFVIFILKAVGSRTQASPSAGNEVDRQATASIPRQEGLRTIPAASAAPEGKSAIESFPTPAPADVRESPAPVKAVPGKTLTENPQPVAKKKTVQNAPAPKKIPDAAAAKPKVETPVQEVVASETPLSSGLTDGIRGIEKSHSDEAAGRPAPQTAVYVKTGDLVALEETDVKPVLVQKIPPVYPPTALMTRQQGSVIVKALISEKGDVLETSIVRGSKSKDRGIFDKAAETAVRKWKFRPARKNGFDVRVWNQYTISFKIDND